MRKRITYTLITLFALLAMRTESHAQQDAMYSQYMFNSLAINPAYAGSRESIYAMALLRRQWLGISGAPKNADAQPANRDAKPPVRFRVECDQ